MEENYLEKKKGKKKWLLVAVLAVAAAALVFVTVRRGGAAQYEEVTAQTRDMSSYLEFSGNVEPSESRSVYASVSARVQEVPVEEGQEVKKGDVIAVLDSSDVEYNIQIQEAALEAAQTSDYYNIKDSERARDQYSAGIESGLNSAAEQTQDALLSAQRQYQDAVDAYNKAKADFEKGDTSEVVSAQQNMDAQAAAYTSAEDQHDKKLITDEALNTYWVAYANAKESYELAVANARKALDDAYDSMTSAEEALAQAERSYQAGGLTAEQTQENNDATVEKAQALANQESTKLQIEQLKSSLDDYTVTAPIDGVITSLNVHEGDLVSLGTGSAQSLAQVDNLSTMKVKVKINEQDVVNVREGDAVTVYVDALERTYDGKIAKLSRTGTIDNDTVYVTAEVEFAADEAVRSGFSAEVTFAREQAPDAVALPVQAVSYNADNTAYVNVRGDDGKPVQRAVSLGISDGEYVQITEGLSDGDVVLIVKPKLTGMQARQQEQMEQMQQMQEEAGGPVGASPQEGAPAPNGQ